MAVTASAVASEAARSGKRVPGDARFFGISVEGGMAVNG